MCTALPLYPVAAFIPGIKIAVTQSNGKVEFEFYRLDERGNPLEERARVHNLAVHIPGGTPYVPGSIRTLWSIITVQQSKMVTHITYGAVPDGFVQENPWEGPAPPLEPGKTYSVSVFRGRRF